MKQSDPNQLQLDFDQAVDGLKAACDKLCATGARLIKSGTKSAPIKKAIKVALEDNHVMIRKQINAAVRHMARLHKQDHRTLWTRLYDRFALITGFDAINVGIINKTAPIEALQQHGKLNGFLQQLAIS